MSVPLDRLYDFLDSISGHDLIIYGWRPHGSKKLQDLTPWRPFSQEWRSKKIQPVLIFHDQEPLDYEFSQACVEQEFYSIAKKWPQFELLAAPKMQKFYKQLHLKSVIEQTFYDLILLVHSEKNSQEVEKYKQNNFVPVYYWCHAAIARDWFRFAEHDRSLTFKSPNSKMFLIYNRAWTGTREYRLKFAEQLITSGLHYDCITSFAETNGLVNYKDHVFLNSAFELDHKNLEKILPRNVNDSAASADYNSSDYQNSQIEIVLETLFDDSRNHLTEKSLRPIACGQPFILAATPGSLKYLREYGFQTFDGYIDESYDCIQDPGKRLHAITQEMQRINKLSAKSKQQLISGMQSVVDHNRRLFFSAEFHSQIVDEFKQNLDQAVDEVKSGSVDSIMKQIRSIAQEHYPELFLKYLHQDRDNLAWAEQWVQSHVKS
jgi:hypothetical protein